MNTWIYLLYDRKMQHPYYGDRNMTKTRINKHYPFRNKLTR